MDITHSLTEAQRGGILHRGLTASPHTKPFLESASGDVTVRVIGTSRKGGTATATYTSPSEIALFLARSGSTTSIHDVTRAMDLTGPPIVDISCAAAPGEEPSVTVDSYDDRPVKVSHVSHELTEAQQSAMQQLDHMDHEATSDPGEDNEFSGEPFLDGLLCDPEKTLYPRTYRGAPKCGTYVPADSPAREFLNIVQPLLDSVHKGLPLSKDLESNSLISNLIFHLLRYDMQMLWPSEALSHTMRDAYPPEGVKWESMLLPFEAMTVLVPKGVINGPHGDALFVSYARAQCDGGVCIFWLVRFEAGGVFGTIEDDRTLLLYGTNLVDQGSVTDTRQCIQQTLNYLLNVLFSLTLNDRRPDFAVSEPRIVGQRQIGGKVVERYFSPRVFGERYQAPPSRKNEGTHASPEFHHVHAFYRRQACGPRWKEHRLTAIKAFTRGKKVAAD